MDSKRIKKLSKAEKKVESIQRRGDVKKMLVIDVNQFVNYEMNARRMVGEQLAQGNLTTIINSKTEEFVSSRWQMIFGVIARHIKEKS